MNQGTGEYTSEQVLATLEATLLRPALTHQELEQFCAETIHLRVPRVCIASKHLAWCKQWYEAKAHQPILVSVIGFPTGAVSTSLKTEEARQAIHDGAAELDMVIDLCAVLEGDSRAVIHDIRCVVDVAPQAYVKVILETCELSDPQKMQAARWAVDAGAACVKTSTGFGRGGARVHDVRLLRQTVGPHVGVKASGGVRTWEAACAMIDAGASRIGTSSMADILSGGSCQAL